MSVFGGAVMVKDSVVGSSLGVEAPFMADHLEGGMMIGFGLATVVTKVRGPEVVPASSILVS